MLGCGHTGSTCLEKEVSKERNFVFGPSQECFCGTEAEFRYLEILFLINPDSNNRFLFLSKPPGPSLVSDLLPLALRRHYHVFLRTSVSVAV